MKRKQGTPPGRPPFPGDTAIPSFQRRHRTARADCGQAPRLLPAAVALSALLAAGVYAAPQDNSTEEPPAPDSNTGTPRQTAADLSQGFELPEQGTPILVDAADARIDRRNGQLVFTDISITQGPLSVKARVAQGSGLSFENSDWSFSDDVRLANGNSLIEASSALLTFRDNALVSARLEGSPVTFQRESTQAPGQLARGRAKRVDYDVTGGTIRLSGDAWVCQGGNEITSEVIVYEVEDERVLADSSASDGRVKILIQPNADKVPAGGCSDPDTPDPDPSTP